MSYFINLFSPETYEVFTRSDRNVSGFRIGQRNLADRIQIGDIFVCYMTKWSRWVGLLRITSEWFEDTTPIYYPEDDPYTLRCGIEPIVWLDRDSTIPIHDDAVWNQLSFTRGQDKNSYTWTGKLRSSLRLMDDSDGQFLERLLLSQQSAPKLYPINEIDYAKSVTGKVRRSDKIVSVSVPESADNDEIAGHVEVRESIKIQAQLAVIGMTMGMDIWLPRNDRQAVLRELKNLEVPIIDPLPLNYDEVTLKTIEQIDVLWLKRRSIIRAFEVEHTTSIYSGLLRMADLLALQPNMDIRLHIVAPAARRDKVFQEITRPVFALLEKGPLYESCTYISYDSVHELANEKHLAHLSDSVLEEYAEQAD